MKITTHAAEPKRKLKEKTAHSLFSAETFSPQICSQVNSGQLVLVSSSFGGHWVY
jgi:hypothetical protein